MEMRFFENIGKNISLLGFGLMRLPVVNEKTQEIDFNQAVKMVDTAIEGGVNYFDTAWMYHDGKSEQFAGEVLARYSRDRYFLATKMPTGMFIKDKKDVDRIFNEQLKKCKTEYFDFYLLHRLTSHNFEHSKKVGVYEYLAKKKEEGYINHLGFSFHDTKNVLKKIISEYEWDFGHID